MSCAYCAVAGVPGRPTICPEHRAILGVIEEFAAVWRRPIPLEVFYCQLRKRGIRVGVERVRRMLELMEMPYWCWSPDGRQGGSKTDRRASMNGMLDVS
jgi:hypothetical protein